MSPGWSVHVCAAQTVLADALVRALGVRRDLDVRRIDPDTPPDIVPDALIVVGPLPDRLPARSVTLHLPPDGHGTGMLDIQGERGPLTVRGPNDILDVLERLAPRSDPV